MRKEKVIILFLCTAVLLAGCKREKSREATVKTIKTTVVNRYGNERSVSFPGKVKASSEVNLAFRISGPIAKVNASEGQLVRKGQILAEMDSRDYEIQLAATEAEYKQIKAEAERIMQLYEMKSVPENDYDKAVSGLQQITAKYNAHKNALDDTRLVAPFDGFIQKRYFDSSETIGAGTPVFSIISAGTPEVEINIPAGEFIRRDQFEAYSCYFEIYPDRIFPLELITINQKANLNQLYTVRFRLKNSKDQMPTPGMSTMVTIQFKPDTVEQVSIPTIALFEKDGESSVWIYDEQKQVVNIRKVKVSEILTDGTLVISHGLKVGERVVTAGVHALSENEKVKLLPQTTATNVGGLL